MEIIKKARAIVKTTDGKIIFLNYNGSILLPGGKIDGMESPLEALRRELKEELGLLYNDKDMVKLMVLEDTQNNFPNKNGGYYNRHVITHVFVLEGPYTINNKYKKLSESEKEKKLFRADYFIDNLDDLDQIIKINHKSKFGHFFNKENYIIFERYFQKKGRRSIV
jgi:8-oxo-dGTP pyrophosphatase MutT (NUDIX family)